MCNYLYVHSLYTHRIYTFYPVLVHRKLTISLCDRSAIAVILQLICPAKPLLTTLEKIIA